MNTIGQIWPCCQGRNIVQDGYGWRCVVCDAFYPEGCEPWAPLEDDEEQGDETFVGD